VAIVQPTKENKMSPEIIKSLWNPEVRLNCFELFYKMQMPYADIEAALGQEVEREFSVWVYNMKEAA